MKPIELSPKLIQLILVLVLVVPLLMPMGLPLPIMQGSRTLYDEINTLMPGSKVLVSMDWAVEQSIELLPQMRIVLQHLFLRPGVKIAIVSFFEQGPMFAEQLLGEIDLSEKMYGDDYANLGFISGGEAGIAAFARDPLGVVPTDFQGRETSSMSALSDVADIKAFDLLVITDSGIPGVSEWVGQVQVPYGLRMACLGTLGTLTKAAPYVQANQVFALMGGVRGAAEYETIMNRPGLSTAGMDAQSIGHIFVILLLIIGNLSSILERRSQGSATKEALR